MRSGSTILTGGVLALTLALTGCGGSDGGNGGNNGDGAADQASAAGAGATARLERPAQNQNKPAATQPATDRTRPVSSPTTNAGDAKTSAGNDKDSGDGDGDDDEQQKPKVDEVIKITGDDQMKYNIDAFTVKPGAKVRIELKHTGKMPRAAMGHNVVIVKQKVKPVPFAGQCVANGGNLNNGYLPKKKKIMKQVVAHTKLIGGGEKTSVTFTVPDKTGKYPFLCTFPAHTAPGMKGTMKVKSSSE